MSASPAPLHEAQLDDASRVLAEAFRDNPLNVAVIGDDAERRLRSNRVGMRALLPLARRHGLLLGAVDAGGARVEGALIATPPGAYPLPPPSLGTQLRLAARQGLRVRARWARVFGHLDAVHPREPHWYLSSLGVAPAARRRGVGRSLLEALVAHADRDGLPCYLETDRPENLAFYEPAGFAVCDESRVLGVPIWHMRRPGRND